MKFITNTESHEYDRFVRTPLGAQELASSECYNLRRVLNYDPFGAQELSGLEQLRDIPNNIFDDM